MSTFVIGDVHGAGQELEALIAKIQPAPTDEIILIGDVIDRGYYGHLVWELIQQYKMPVLMGNHERKMQKFFRRERDGVPLHYLWAFENLFETTKTVSQEDFIAWLDALPLLLQRGDVLLAHAGVNVLRPTEPHEACNVYGNPFPDGRPRQDWWKVYDGNRLVVWGHLTTPDGLPMFWKNRQGKVNSVCIDTSVVHGGPITAYCLETGDVIQHQSGVNHFRNLKNEMRQKLPGFRL